MKSERIQLALIAMERKSDAATHALKSLQQKMLGFNDAEKEALNRQSQSIENLSGDETNSMIAIAKWRGSTDHLLAKIDHDRRIVEDDLTKAKAEAATCCMRLEALKAIHAKTVQEDTLQKQRQLQNQLPSVRNKLI